MDKSLQVEDWDAYIYNTGIIASRLLRKDGIELVIYSKVKTLLGMGYESFIQKINGAFDITKEG